MAGRSPFDTISTYALDFPNAVLSPPPRDRV
jgi:hypothetical protein